MLRDNIKKAINKSNLIVKEIANESGVKKRTIDKWVGIKGTEPKVNDFYKVCKVLSVTMEEMVNGENGINYVRKLIANDPRAVQVPERIFPIVECLLLLDDRELGGILANVKALAIDKKGTQKTGTEVTEIAG